MRIIVLGAGEVGQEIAKVLTRENADVVVIDQNQEALRRVSTRLDLMTIQGNGTALDTLQSALIHETDMFIAVTSIDEVNLVACMMASKLGVETTIARVRSDEFRHSDAVLKDEDLGINLIIHPEQSTAEEIYRLVRRASASDVLAFGDGNLLLVGMRMIESSPVLRKKIRDILEDFSELNFRIMGITRGVRTILPDGNERLHANDQVFVLCDAQDYEEVSGVFGHSKSGVLQNVMISGGSTVAAVVARKLSDNKEHKVKLIVPDINEAESLAESLPNVLVLHGEASDLDLLVMEGVAEMDAFIAATDNEASNLVTCLMAKNLGVTKTVGLLSNPAYIPISQRIGLDAAVNLKLSVSKEVLRHLRGSHISSIATIQGLDAEILEIKAAPRSKITKDIVQKLNIPKGLSLGALTTNGKAKIIDGQTHISEGDDVICFVNSSQIKSVEKLFN